MVETIKQSRETIQARMDGPVLDEFELRNFEPPALQTMDELHANEHYQAYGKMLYDLEHGQPKERDMPVWKGRPREHPETGEEYAQYLSSRMAWMNNNIGSMVVNWYKVSKMTTNQALALRNAFTMYNNTDLTEGWENTIVPALTDPLNWVGFRVMKGVSAFPKWYFKKQLDDLALRAAKNYNRRALGRAFAEGAIEGMAMGTGEAALHGEIAEKTGEEYEHMGAVTGMGAMGAGTTTGIAQGAKYADGARQFIRRLFP